MSVPLYIVPFVFVFSSLISDVLNNEFNSAVTALNAHSVHYSREKRGFLQFSQSILDLTVNNIFKAYDDVRHQKNHEELIAHFQKLESLLTEQKSELKAINEEIKMLRLTIGYAQHEENIKDSLSALNQYLEQSDVYNRNIFFGEAGKLTKSISAIMDGLLSENAFNVDILAGMRDVVKCHGRQLEEKMKPIEWLTMAGIQVFVQFQVMRNVSDPTKSSFAKTITEQITKWNKRRDEMVNHCRNAKDRKNIINEMRQIIEINSDSNRNDVAAALLSFLEDKYDTKKWIVIVESISRRTSTTIDFFSIVVNNTAAYAICTDGSPKLPSLVSSYWNNFTFPLSGNRQTSFRDKVEPYLMKYLTLLRSNSQIYATLISEEPNCGMLLRQNKESLPVVVSSIDFEYLQMNGTFINTSRCVDIKVMVVPVSETSTSITSSLQPANLSNCFQRKNYSESGMLRHDYIQGYLSVEGNSEEEGTSIILEREWRNDTGQRWRFVNNQLRNDNGKCLTAWNKKSWNLYQYDCHSDWTGQTWSRRGLQIINANSFCLAFVGTKNDSIMYVVQDDCDATPPFLWYESNCEEAAVMINSTFPRFRHLRNEYSKQFLNGLGIDGERVLRYPWVNRAGQYWQWIDGHLKNANEMCLAGKGWDVIESGCAAVTSDSRWKYNERRQIVSAEGYCLSVTNSKDYRVYYNYCKDDPEQRWEFTL